jgi:organic anion transporter 2B/organic anion transporter 3A
MDPRDPRWIGAWWLGFVVFGIASLFLALPLALFPRQLKMSAKDIAKGKIQERTIVEQCSFLEKVKSKQSIKENMLYSFNCIAFFKKCFMSY